MTDDPDRPVKPAANSPVLFLDANYAPLRVEHWQRAVADEATGKVEVVHYSRDRQIYGETRSYPLPSVVRVIRAFRRDRIRVKFSRLNVYVRDGWRCQYCGGRFASEDLTFDHVVPRSHGGRTTWENVVACCRECNGAKADRTPAEAGMPLLSAPRKPHTLPSVTVRGMDARSIPPEWRDYWSAALED